MSDLKLRVKEMIIERLKLEGMTPDQIEDGAPLFGEGLGLDSIDQLKKARGYFIVGAFIVAAVVTPPDVISQLALAIPMCILYELGIVAARIFAQQTQAPGAEAQAGDKPAG